MKNNLVFSEEELKKINKAPLADKWEVSESYVGEVLRNNKGKNKKALQIRQDARAILNILDNPINQIEVVDPVIVKG